MQSGMPFWSSLVLGSYVVLLLSAFTNRLRVSEISLNFLMFRAFLLSNPFRLYCQNLLVSPQLYQRYSFCLSLEGFLLCRLEKEIEKELADITLGYVVTIHKNIVNSINENMHGL